MTVLAAWLLTAGTIAVCVTWVITQADSYHVRQQAKLMLAVLVLISLAFGL